MKLESRLQDHDEQSFLSLVTTLWNVETQRSEHNALIDHFDQIVGHPAGSDLLFYSNAEAVGAINSPEHIVATIKSWHQRNGLPAFKGQHLQPRRELRSMASEQRASQSSTRNLEKVRKLVAQVHAAEQQATLQLAALEQQLTIDPVASTPEQQLAFSLATLRALESIQHQAAQAVFQLERLHMSVKFALDAAVRDATSPFLDAAIQAVALQEMNAGSQRHAAALAMAQGRHSVLYARGVTLIEHLEARIAQLAKATGAGPGHGPLTLVAAADASNLHPALLMAQGLNGDVAQQQRHLIKTVRSAVAELEWQATSLQGDHPGTYADLIEFVQGTPSDDPRFGLTVPLAEILDEDRQDWADLAAERAEVDLPMRLCSMVRGARSGSTKGVKPFTRYCHVLMTSTQGPIVPSRVRVREAGWDAGRRAFAFTSETGAPVTVLWQKGSAPYPPIDISRPPSISYLHMPNVPIIERFMDLTQVQFDDYIVVFPPQAGLAPVYVMFRDRREL